MFGVSGIRKSALFVILAGLAWALPAHAQVLGGPIVTGGVAINPDGTVENRTVDPDKQLAEMRRRLADSSAAERQASRDLKCISLPKLFAQAHELLAAGKPLPDDLKYLGGLTQIQYVFVYPEQKDIVIAGPAEAWLDGDSLEPVGKVSGRPVMQFFDLVAAMRTVNGLRGRTDFFGCSIDMPPNSMETSDSVARKYENRPTPELIAAMTKAMGPQKVSIIGTADDTRLALAMVAADYKLKRFTLGMEVTPVSGLGSAFDGSRAAGCRFWFEPLYDPLVVSEDGNAYAIHGQRLQIKAGAQSFDTKGVTPRAKAFATTFTSKIPLLVKVEPAFADLQNIADLALVRGADPAGPVGFEGRLGRRLVLRCGSLPRACGHRPAHRGDSRRGPQQRDRQRRRGLLHAAHRRQRRATPAKAGAIPAAPAPLAVGAWQSNWTPPASIKVGANP